MNEYPEMQLPGNGDFDPKLLQKLIEQMAEDQAGNRFDALCERVTMSILGKGKDPSPGVNWHCNRAWRVEKVRELVRAALEKELMQ